MPISTPPGYARLDEAGVRQWLAAEAALAARLGGTPAEWQIDEVGDGNLNIVYVIRGPAGGVCVKQSLPYVRVAGESWPMPLERAYFEQLYLRTSEPAVSGLTPRLLHYDPVRFAFAMELLGEHLILRRGLIAGHRYPTAARRVGEYVARSAFATSVLAEPFERVNDRLAAFACNQALTRITVDLIFTHPYRENERNRWTSPQLDDAVASLRADARLKAAVGQLGYRFMTLHEALLHGDLHTGSVMVNATDTRVIDAEFAIYGPIGFDLGLFIGNLLMAYFSQPGHGSLAPAPSQQAQGSLGLADESFGHDGGRRKHGEWILAQIVAFWHEFVARFSALWSAKRAGDGYPISFITTPEDAAAFALERQQWLARLHADTLGYAGAEIIRRIVGFAHNADFETIQNPDLRGSCERRSLAFARELIVTPGNFPTIEAVIEAAAGLSGTP